jgi:hypothetical protein
MQNMRKLFTLCCIFFAALYGNAQGSIKGKLTDSSGKNPLGLATVTVFQAGDTSLITYRLSTPEGEFRVPGLPLNKPLRLVISYSGYEAHRQEFTLTNDTPLEMGTISLLPSSKTLDEILVVAERPPVTVRRDTIEFNASSFRTLPTALVEDLLKKLPGIQIDRDGNIMANGRRVNRIQVDGKSFFGDDPKMATRNLPANLIDKIQVTEDKDEAARNTDGDLTNVGQVINLTLKKGVKKGWFGKAYAGMGTKERYEVGGIANIFRDTLQLSVLGFSNNINRSGFSFKEIQDMGGFSRSGFNSVTVMRRGSQEGFAINGISFGGLDGGIARSSGAGFNLNHAPNKRNNFFVQYFVGNSRNTIEDVINKQQFFSDTTLTTRTGTTNNRNGYSHNASIGTTLKPDTLTDINFRMGYSYATQDEDINSSIRVTNNKAGQVSTGAGNLFNNTYNNDYYHNLFLTRRFSGKKGRTFNLYNILNYRNNLQRYITETESQFFIPAPDELLFEQLRRQDVPTLSTTVNAAFSEPLSSKWTMRINGRYEFLKDEQDISLYIKDAGSKYDLLDMGRSSGFQRRQNRFSTNFGLTYKLNKVNLTAGVSGLWQDIHNEFRNIATPVDMNLFSILPNFSLTWKQLSVRYDKNVSAPSIGHLIPVPDSTNPFFIRHGNPYLRPAKRNSFSISNFSFLQSSGTSFNVYLNANFINDDVIMARTIATNGVETVKPVNADGSINMHANVGFGKEYKNNQKFIFSFRFTPYVSFDSRKLSVNNNISTATTFSYGPGVTIGLNWNDIVELRPEYRPHFSRTTYTDPYFRNIKAITHYLETELIIRWPKMLVWESQLSYRSTNQVAPGLPKDNVLWNAAVTLLMLKDSKGLLKLSVFDVLDRNNNVYRYTTMNQIVDQQSNVLTRFAELSFTYNIRNLGAAKKVGGRDRMFLF